MKLNKNACKKNICKKNICGDNIYDKNTHKNTISGKLGLVNALNLATGGYTITRISNRTSY